MLNQFHTPTTTTTTFHDMYSDEFDTDSNCSTPYVSAPSSPNQYQPPTTNPVNFFYYSAPASPVHYISSSPAAASGSKNYSETSPASSTCSFEFDFSATLTTNGSASPGSLSTMISADELFFNGQIRPVEISDDRGRAMKYRDKSKRRTRSMSPLRTMPFDWQEEFEIIDQHDLKRVNTDSKKPEVSIPAPAPAPGESEPSSPPRSSSAGRNLKRWVFLKEFLYRSKSEGRNNGNKFWNSLSSLKNASKEKIVGGASPEKGKQSGVNVKKKTTNGVGGGGKKRVPAPSAHEMLYTANRAQAEEMRKKTYLPYKQGLFGCLGFNSKNYYGAMNGFARTLNPVSSR